jgi:hypothetical protein
MNHLTRRELLLHADGELTRGRERAARDHLLSCWACRRELERLKEDINAIVDAQNRCFLPSTARPQRPWASFQELAATAPQPRFRIGPWVRQIGAVLRPRALGPVHWAFGLGALVCLGILIVWLNPARLSAAGVLGRMERAESFGPSPAAHKVIRQTVRIDRADRGSSGKRSTEVQSWRSETRNVWRGDDNGLRQRYRSRNLDAALPLSVSACEHWLNEAHTEPQVSQTATTIELRARVEPATGEPKSNPALNAVHLHVRADNWRVESLQLTFSDTVFDIREVDLTVLGPEELSADLLAELEPSPAPMRSPTPAPASGARAVSDLTLAQPVDLSELELQARLHLHEAGADLSEPIEIGRDKDHLVIDASGASPQRKKELAEMFADAAPGIQLKLESSPAGGPQGTPIQFAVQAETRATPDEKLVAYFGGPEQEESFTRSVLSADASILARLYALNTLAKRWPAGLQSTLSDESQSMLRSMVRDHSTALHLLLPRLRNLLGPLAEGFCGSPLSKDGSVSGREAWQDAAVAGLVEMRTLDRRLRATLTTSDQSTSAGEVCSALSSGLASVESSAANLPVAQ